MENEDFETEIKKLAVETLDIDDRLAELEEDFVVSARFLISTGLAAAVMPAWRMWLRRPAVNTHSIQRTRVQHLSSVDD